MHIIFIIFVRNDKAGFKIILKFFKKEFCTKEYLLFLVIGGINTLDCALFAEVIRWLGMDVNLAFNMGYFLSNVVAYVLNCYFVFPSKLSVGQYVRFALSYVPNFVIENLVVLVSYNYYTVPPLASFLLAAFVAMPITFLLVKLYAFGRRIAK